MRDGPTYGYTTISNQELDDLRTQLAECQKDAELLDFIERKSKESRTGVGFDWAPRVENEKAGFRMMWYHKLHDRKKTVREAVIEAMEKEHD